MVTRIKEQLNYGDVVYGKGNDLPKYMVVNSDSISALKDGVSYRVLDVIELSDLLQSNDKFVKVQYIGYLVSLIDIVPARDNSLFCEGVSLVKDILYSDSDLLSLISLYDRGTVAHILSTSVYIALLSDFNVDMVKQYLISPIIKSDIEVISNKLDLLYRKVYRDTINPLFYSIMSLRKLYGENNVLRKLEGIVEFFSADSYIRLSDGSYGVVLERLSGGGYHVLVKDDGDEVILRE